jgi:7-keto-8-aminopelargonate synthetase-like enzyme
MTDEQLVKWLRNEHRKYVAGTIVTTTRYLQAAARIEALTTENERLRLKLEQASHHLKAGAKVYECPGLAASAIAAREALEKQP